MGTKYNLTQHQANNQAVLDAVIEVRQLVEVESALLAESPATKLARLLVDCIAKKQKALASANPGRTWSHAAGDHTSGPAEFAISQLEDIIELLKG